MMPKRLSNYKPLQLLVPSRMALVAGGYATPSTQHVANKDTVGGPPREVADWSGAASRNVGGGDVDANVGVTRVLLCRRDSLRR